MECKRRYTRKELTLHTKLWALNPFTAFYVVRVLTTIGITSRNYLPGRDTQCLMRPAMKSLLGSDIRQHLILHQGSY